MTVQNPTEKARIHIGYFQNFSGVRIEVNDVVIIVLFVLVVVTEKNGFGRLTLTIVFDGVERLLRQFGTGLKCPRCAAHTSHLCVWPVRCNPASSTKTSRLMRLNP